MENILGVGGITISDLNDAIISGDAPRNPDEGALWIDSSAKTPILKVYKNGSWQPQEIDVNNLDPELSETVTTIVNTLGTLANDGLLTYTDRLQLSVEIASIIGQIPSKQNGNVYPNTLPAYNIIDSLGVGSFSNLRQTARDATVPTDNTYYIALEQAYTALNTYLSSLTPRPWDVTLTNKDINTEVANPDTYREALLNYYLAELNLATYTEKRATEAANEYTDESVHDVIISVDVEYATSTDSTTVPEDDKWDILAPTWSNGIFIWSRTITTYKNGTTFISEPVNITQDIEISERNLIRDSGELVSVGQINQFGIFDLLESIEEGTDVTLVYEAAFDNPDMTEASLYWQNNNGDTLAIVDADINHLGWGKPYIYKVTFKWENWKDGYGDVQPEQQLNTQLYDPTGANNAHITWIKLVKGNKTSSSWLPAPEDTDKKITDGMEEVSSAINAEWKTEADSIRGDVEATYVTANDFATLQTDISTTFEQTESAFDFRFNETEKLVSEVGGNVETLENEIKKYIRFVDGSIILGAEGSTSEVIITNEKISFMQGGDKPVAFIEGQKMQINHGIFVDSATIAGFKFELVPGTDDVLGITWTN